MSENNKFQFVDMEDITEESKEDSKEADKTVDISRRFYFSFEARIIVSVLAILLLFIGACFLGLKVINHTTTEYVEYLENADFNYQVCLNDATCEPENIIYNAEDINVIKLSFKYDAKYKKKINNSYSYKITSIISAHNREDNTSIYQKEIDLVEKSPLYNSDGSYHVDDVVTIDFAKYKGLVRDSEDTVKQVEVVFYVEENNEIRKVAGLVIPLSKDKFELDKFTTANTTRKAKMKVNIWDAYSLVYGIATSILTIVSLILIYRTTRLVLKVANNKNEYEEAVDSLLKEYDNIIVVARDGYESIVEREIIKIDEFEELVKVRDRLNKPIIFSKVNNVKSEFIVEDDNMLYKYVMKEADFTEDDKNKLENK